MLQAGPSGSMTLQIVSAAAQERNLIPCAAVHLQEAIAEKLLEQPLSVHASGISVAHPEKARDPNARAVNRKHLGWGGEDAYFHDSRLAHSNAQRTCLMHARTVSCCICTS